MADAENASTPRSATGPLLPATRRRAALASGIAVPLLVLGSCLWLLERHYSVPAEGEDWSGIEMFVLAPALLALAVLAAGIALAAVRKAPHVRGWRRGRTAVTTVVVLSAVIEAAEFLAYHAAPGAPFIAAAAFALIGGQQYVLWTTPER